MTQYICTDTEYKLSLPQLENRMQLTYNTYSKQDFHLMSVKTTVKKIEETLLLNKTLNNGVQNSYLR